jgi:DNA-binding transcriptional LysR family regulator
MELHGLVSHSVLDWTAAGQCDVGFAAAPVEHAAVQTEKMPSVRLVAVVPAAHRLARKRVLRPEDFAGQNFIALNRSATSRFRIDAVFEAHGVRPEIHFETPLSLVIASAVSANAGVALIEPFTAHARSFGGLAIRPFEPAIEFDFAALLSSYRPVPRAAREYIDQFRAAVEAFRDHYRPRGLA